MRRLSLWFGMALFVGGLGCGSPSHDSSGPEKNESAAEEGEVASKHASWIDNEGLQSLTGDRHATAWNSAFHLQCHTLRWPAALSKQFHASINAFGRDVTLPTECLEEYQELAAGFVSDLKKIVEPVEWNGEALSQIRARFAWHERPLSIQVGLAQEDLWSYEGILHSMAWSNKNACENEDDAPVIARIKVLEVGQPAATAMASAQQKMALRTYFGRMSGLGTCGGLESEQSFLAETSEEERATPDQVAENLLTGRYVDLAGTPLAAASRPYPEFDLLPVHIVVLIDQGKPPCFLDRLSRYEMPVDVKYVNVCADGEFADPDTPIVILPPMRDYVDVEILGVIRIFNPPEKK